MKRTSKLLAFFVIFILFIIVHAILKNNASPKIYNLASLLMGLSLVGVIVNLLRK